MFDHPCVFTTLSYGNEKQKKSVLQIYGEPTEKEEEEEAWKLGLHAFSQRAWHQDSAGQRRTPTLGGKLAGWGSVW